MIIDTMMMMHGIRHTNAEQLGSSGASRAVRLAWARSVTFVLGGSAGSRIADAVPALTEDSPTSLVVGIQSIPGTSLESCLTRTGPGRPNFRYGQILWAVRGR